MKQVAQNYRSGEISLVEVPVPACKRGGLVVRSLFSLVSMGTEAMKIHESKLSLVGKARARPDQVKKVMQSVSQQGAVATYKKVMNRLDSLTPLGYSLCGEVVEVGEGMDGYEVGQLVACGGNLHALHADFNWVPKNLCVPVPEGVGPAEASFATVGSIAMQGFRQSEAKLGETACVIGLGLLGQLMVQILRAAGVRVFGVDISEERCALAERMGAAKCGVPGTQSFDALSNAIGIATRGAGVDYVFLTAGGSSNQPVELAAELARDRARIVDIGKCSLDLPWKDYYEKELDVRFSRSYGPGRYDPSYEDDGVDYPIGYVRWTENRNMECFLDLLESKKIDLEPLITHVRPFDQAVETYEAVNKGELGGLGILFEYPAEAKFTRRIEVPAIASKGRAKGASVGLGVIGAGNYASTMILPHIKDRDDVRMIEVATATALSAANAQKKFGFERVSTDFEGLLEDTDIDAVMIMTRHHAHAAMVCKALAAGKAVFVEKPLAVSERQLAQVVETIRQTGNDRLMVGFNRRFAPALAGLKAEFGKPGGPLALQLTVNAGPLENGSWYARSQEEGSRFVGEGCHFVDLASWWLESAPVKVFAAATPNDPDNLQVTMFHEDGSVSRIAYLTQGDPRYPKEVLEVFGEGSVARMDNYASTEVWRKGKRSKQNFRGVDKGQRHEVAAFIDAVKSGAPMPIGLESLVATTAATFAVTRSLGTGAAEPVAFTAEEQAFALDSGMDAAQ